MISKLNTQKNDYLQTAVFMLPFQGACRVLGKNKGVAFV